MNKKVISFCSSRRGVLVKENAWKSVKWPGSIPVYATRAFRLVLDWKKSTRENKRGRAFRNSGRVLVFKAKCWKSNCPGSITACDTSTFTLVLDWMKSTRRIKSVFSYSDRGVVVKAKCCKPKWPASNPIFATRIFWLVPDLKKRIRENRKVRAFSNSPRGVLVKAKCWRRGSISGPDRSSLLHKHY